MCVQACWIWGWSIELATLTAFILIRMGARKAKELRQVIHEERYLVGQADQQSDPLDTTASCSCCGKAARELTVLRIPCYACNGHRVAVKVTSPRSPMQRAWHKRNGLCCRATHKESGL